MPKTFEVNLYKGSIRDVYGNAVSVSPTKSFIKTDKGFSLDGSGNGIRYTNPITPQTGAYTLVAVCNGSSTSNIPIIAPATGSPGGIFSYVPAGNGFLAYLGNGNYRYFNYIPDNGWHIYMLVVPGDAQTDINNTKLYVDGFEQTVKSTVVTGNQERTLANTIGTNASYFSKNIAYVAMYNEAISQSEINRLTDWFYALKNTISPKNGFDYPKPTDISSQDNRGLILAFNDIQGDKVVDLSSNYSLLKNGRLVSSGDGILFPNLTSNGIYTSTAVATSNTETLQFSFKYLDNSNTGLLYRHLSFNAGGYQVYLLSSGQLAINTHQSGANIATSLQVLNKNTFNTLTLSIDNANSKVFSCLNGVTTEYTITPYVSTTANLRVGDSEGAASSLPMVLYDFRQWSRLLSETEMKAYHNAFYKPTYKDDISDYGADNVAKIFPDFIPVSGSFKVSELPADTSFLKKGQKYLECVTTGQMALPSSMAYGSWEFDWFKATNANTPSVGFALPSIASYFSLGYAISAYTDNSIRLYKNGSVGSMFYTNPNYVQIGTWYKCRVTRDNSGKFTVLIKGGNFTPTAGYDGFTLVGDLAAGTNPVTENSYKTSNYIVFYGNAGDRLANLKAWPVVPVI